MLDRVSVALSLIKCYIVKTLSGELSTEPYSVGSRDSLSERFELETAFRLGDTVVLGGQTVCAGSIAGHVHVCTAPDASVTPSSSLVDARQCTSSSTFPSR